MVEKLLVDSLWVLVGEQAADCQLLVDEVGHGELLAYELRRELVREESAVAQEGWSLWMQRRTRVVLAGRMRQTMRLGGGLSIPEAALDGKGSRTAQGTQMAGGGQERRRTVVEDAQVQIPLHCIKTNKQVYPYIWKVLSSISS